MKYAPIKLSIDYIKELRDCVCCNDYLILNNKPYNQDWNILCACMDRIEDTVKYLNSKKLGQEHSYGCAFDLMEFLTHAAMMLDCLDTMIEVLKAGDQIKAPPIIFKWKVITNQDALNKRLAKIKETKPYKNEDDLYFEYIRSIGAVHPNGTARHPYFQQYDKEVSPFLVWNHLVGLADGDISLHVYDLNGKNGIRSLKLYLAEIHGYILNRYNRISMLKDVFDSNIKHLKSELRSQKILSKEEFRSPNEYLSYLKVEAHKRSDYAENCVEETMKMIELDGIPEKIKLQYSKYCNALMYSMNNLGDILQTLLEDDFNEEILARALHLPRLLRKDETNMTCYYYEKTGNLYNAGQCKIHDIVWFRTQAKILYRIVKNYAPVDDNTLEQLGDLQLLAVLNTALYFYSLDHDTFINEKIPKTNTYR